jgi:hypothetical protein
LRTIPVHVTSPGLPTSGSQAISEVVGAAGHFLDHCRPRATGVAVVGRIDPPSGDAPPLHARCSVSLRREPGFYLAQVLVVTPPRLQGVVHLKQQPYNEVSILGAPLRTNVEGIAWEFVVTQRAATSVDWAVSLHDLGGGGTAPDGIWSSAGWRQSAWENCGGSGSGSAGSAKAGWSGAFTGSGSNGPGVEFVSDCGR